MEAFHLASRVCISTVVRPDLLYVVFSMNVVIAFHKSLVPAVYG